MQENEFEREIRKKMEEFALVPKEHVWEGVNARIRDDKRKRRTMLVWFFAAILLLIVGIFEYLLVNPVGNKNESFVKRSNVSGKNQHEVKPAEEIKQKSVKVPVVRPKAKTTHTAGAIANRKRESEILKEVSVAKRASAEDNNLTGALLNLKNKNNGANGDISKSINEGVTTRELRANNETLLPHKFYNPNARFDSTVQRKTEQIVLKANDNSSKSLRKQKANKVTFGITAAAGISDNRTNFPLFTSASSQLVLDNAAPSTGSGNWSSSQLTPLSFKKAFSFSLGFYLNKPISKKLSLSAEIDYHYYSASTNVGSSITTPRTIYDSLLQYSAMVNAFFNPGQSVNVINTYHFLEIPISVNLRLNKNIQKPVSITAGITPGLLVGSSALYANYSSQVYYKEKNQFTNFQMGAQVGLSFYVTKVRNAPLSVGPVAQYYFTNLTKEATKTNQHLFFTGIKTHIALH